MKWNNLSVSMGFKHGEDGSTMTAGEFQADGSNKAISGFHCSTEVLTSEGSGEALCCETIGKILETHVTNQNRINDAGRVFEEMMSTATYPNEGYKYA
jgi:hypothetical protein